MASLVKGLRLCAPRIVHSMRTKLVSTANTPKTALSTESSHAAPMLQQNVRHCQTISTKEKAYPVDVVHDDDVEKLCEMYDTFLLDCDGVLWGTDHCTRFHNMHRSIQKLRNAGKHIIFVTNNSMHARTVYEKKFKDMCNFEASPSDVFSVNYAAALYLKSIAKVTGKVYAIGSKGMTEELHNLEIETLGFGTDPDPITDYRDDLLAQDLDPDVEAVLVGFDIHIGYNKIYKAASYLSHENCLYVATNDIETRVPIGSNRIQPLTGVITEAINTASNRKPVVVGKPYSHLMACVLAANPQIDLNRTIMVGDSMKTDIGFANNAGIDSILVLTGATKPEDLQNYNQAHDCELPTYILPSFSRFGDIL